VKRLAIFVLSTACATTSAAPPKPTVAHVDDSLARWDATPKAPLAWSEFSDATFARAKTEKRFVVMDGSAEWCHWCHVMEAVTYHDAQVRTLLDAHFIAAKVDIDARPDIEERYADYGWPATVIFSPDGRELGKYRGFIAPEKFVEILNAVVASKDEAASTEASDVAISDAPMPEEELAWIARATELGLEDYWDEEQGSWGHGQKVPLFMTNAWALSRARAGDALEKKRVLFTLDQQRGIVDPVWGGIYQYSTDGDWKHPHFEKLLYFNAGAIANYAEAYELTKDKKWLDVATAIKGYVDRFLSGKDGGFYVTQDADLNAHEVGKGFVTGHEYYAKGEAERLALGLPRVDMHEYARENGLGIAAYCKYFEATGEASALERAKKAADLVLATHATKGGALSHDVASSADSLVHLSDNAAFAFALLELARVSKDAARAAQAAKIVDAIFANLEDTRGGGFFASSKDPDAVGVFAVRRKPFEDNVTMLRVLARLARAMPERAAQCKRGIERTLRAIATPEKIRDRGRMIGDFLIALEETKGAR
jgi:hypothetical protein